MNKLVTETGPSIPKMEVEIKCARRPTRLDLYHLDSLHIVRVVTHCPNYAQHRNVLTVEIVFTV